MNKDYFNNHIWSYSVEKQAKFILDKISDNLNRLSSNCKLYLLNVGCGGGSLEYILKEILKFPVYIISLDINIEACKNVKKNAVTDNLIVNADIKAPPIKGNSIDCILFMNSYHHIPKVYRDNLVKEIMRVMKDKGKIIMQEPLKKIWREPAKIFFKKKWKMVHAEQERELDKEDLEFIFSYKNFKEQLIKPFTFIFQPLLYIKLPNVIKKFLVKIRIIDDCVVRFGMGWTYWITFAIDKPTN